MPPLACRVARVILWPEDKAVRLSGRPASRQRVREFERRIMVGGTDRIDGWWSTNKSCHRMIENEKRESWFYATATKNIFCESEMALL